MYPHMQKIFLSRYNEILTHYNEIKKSFACPLAGSVVSIHQRDKQTARQQRPRYGLRHGRAVNIMHSVTHYVVLA